MEVVLALSALVGAYTVGFWVVFVIAAFLMLAAISEDRGVFSTIMTVVVGALVVVKWPVVAGVLMNPVALIGIVIGYALVGLAWGRIKWGKFLSVKLDEIVTARNKYLKASDATVESIKTGNYGKGSFDDYVRFLSNTMGRYTFPDLDSAKDLSQVAAAVTPLASRNKASIVMWIVYWPLSIAIYLLRDLLVDFGNAIYRAVGGYFQSAADEKFQQL